MEKVVLAYSGGLDTSYCAVYLSKIKKLEVHAVLVDLGGFSPTELQAIENRALELGVASFTVLNVQEQYYDECLKYLVFGNVLKNNTYPLSVSSERVFQARALALYAQKIGARCIAHGSTGAGNDQVRFDSIFQVLLPGVEILTPIRDQKLSRDEEIEFLRSHGVEMDFQKAQYSVNKGLWGTSIGGKETLGSLGALPEEAYPTPATKKQPEYLALYFEKGELKKINGSEFQCPIEAIRTIARIAQPFGIGRDVHVGDTIIGIKGRVAFEAAAPLIIIKAHHLLEKHTLTKAQMLLKDQVTLTYANLIHDGQVLDPVVKDIEALLASSQEKVTGEVTLELHPFHFNLLGVASKNDLMNKKYASYGEENPLWNAQDMKGFIKINSNALSIYHKVHENGN